MRGSIQAKSGKYYAVLSFVSKEDGKYKYKWVATGLPLRGNKKKAEAMLPELIKQYEYLELDNSKVTDPLFADYIREWLDNKKGHVQQSTWEGYESYINLHIIPYFETLGLTVKQVTPQHIKEYYDSRLKCSYAPHKKGLSARSIKKHAPILNQVFEQAIIAGIVVNNPVAVVPLPKQEEHEPVGKFMTAEEANIMLEAFRGHELQPVVYVALYYGLRRSEVLGLKWGAIDFENNTIKIEHTVVKQSTIISKDTTKSFSSRRTYPMLNEIRELLLSIKEKQQQNREFFGDSYTESGYVFVWGDGKPFRPDYVTRTFQKVLEKNGLPRLRFHDLRHSAASILYDLGWQLKDISDWLGHADLTTTGNVYTHISRLRKENVAKDLDSLFHL